ncbi:MAG TPA: hypoxanthine-guanine phosphoribosyltransferase [Acidiferrobacter sp.]|nr:hypoxanthine-guanine phosphoribosyltransferase [Acidiferrobacter sp.]
MGGDRTIQAREAWRVLETAEQLFAEADVDQALDRMAVALHDAVAGANPILMVVLNGALIFAGHLLPRLAFPLEVDYVHATRYRGAQTGGNLAWVAGPSMPVVGRTVVLLDDILDEGTTLAALSETLEARGAACVLKAVLVTKVRSRAPRLEADFSGLDVPDRYVFGCGMDYDGYLRNTKGIYALK